MDRKENGPNETIDEIPVLSLQDVTHGYLIFRRSGLWYDLDVTEKIQDQCYPSKA